MHDGAHFEEKGIPSAVLVSDAFKPQAQYQAKSLGLQNAARVFIKHPISDQTQEQLRQKAERAYTQVVAALTTEAAPVAADAAQSNEFGVEGAEGACCTKKSG